MDFKEQQKIDPVEQQGEKDTQHLELSPMDPPDAYSPPSVEEVPYEEMHVILQEFIDEHEEIKKALTTFEETLIAIQNKGITRKADEKLREFFHFFDHEFIPHDHREEKELFPLLAKRLVENGEHSNGPTPTTAVDMMEDDHIKVIQQVAVIFNFFGLMARLPDERSRLLVLDAAIEQGKAFVELLQLHIFRENSIVFPLAHKYISSDEFNQMQRKGAVSVEN